jgi:hypothetical protein
MVSFNSALSRTITKVFLYIYDCGTGNFNISLIGFTQIIAFASSSLSGFCSFGVRTR